MENGNLEFSEMEIGIEQPKIEAKKVKVLSYEEVDVKDKEQKDIGKKLVLKVSHPDVPELELSKVKYEKNKKLKESGIWLSQDGDGNIPYNAALAHLLRHYGCSKVADLKDKELDTICDDNGFLIVKAY